MSNTICSCVCMCIGSMMKCVHEVRSIMYRPKVNHKNNNKKKKKKNRKESIK